VAASLLLMLPAFLHGIPNGDDAAMHYRRHADFIEALREGVWYPRWLPRSSFSPCCGPLFGKRKVREEANSTISFFAHGRVND